VGTNHVSGTAVARVIIFCIQIGYVKSQPKNDKLTVKGAWSGSRDPLLIYASPVVSVEQLKLESNFSHR